MTLILVKSHWEGKTSLKKLGCEEYKTVTEGKYEIKESILLFIVFFPLPSPFFFLFFLPSPHLYCPQWKTLVLECSSQSSPSREDECLYVKSCFFHQEKGIVSKYEIKDIKEITKIKICLEGENMTRKYIVAIILRNLSHSHFFSLLLQINLWSCVQLFILSCEGCGS